MADGNAQFGPAKNLRVSTTTHRLFTDYQHKVRAKSAEDAMRALLGEDVVRISVPPAVRERWEIEAEEAGFPLEQWIAQRVEAAIAYRADAREIRVALDRLMVGALTNERVRKDQEAQAAYVACGNRHGDTACVLGAGHTGTHRNTVTIRPSTQSWGPCSTCRVPSSCKSGAVMCGAEQVPSYDE